MIIRFPSAGRWLAGFMTAVVGFLVLSPSSSADNGRGRKNGGNSGGPTVPATPPARPDFNASPFPGNTAPTGPSSVENVDPAPSTATSYSGRAVALRIDDVEEPVPGPIVLADTGALPSTGGTLDASEMDFKLMADDGVTVALSVELAQASVVGSGNLTTADASLTNFHVLVQTPAGEVFSVDADYIAASASAAIATNGNGATQSSVAIQNLRVDGVVVNVTGQANQVVTVPGGKLVLNEQTKTTATGSARITVSALHLYIEGCMNGAVGTVTAGIAGDGQSEEPHECGKLTGGGWIASPSGAKATFAVSGGIRRGEFWGHLNYIDHGASVKVQSTEVTDFYPNPDVPGCRVIHYDVMINGLGGTAIVDAWDKGEPGRNDFFSIKLSTGYSARGTLGNGEKGGGNLQLHKCPPGWEK